VGQRLGRECDCAHRSNPYQLPQTYWVPRTTLFGPSQELGTRQYAANGQKNPSATDKTANARLRAQQNHTLGGVGGRADRNSWW
jgi:hypothetical protein